MSMSPKSSALQIRSLPYLVADFVNEDSLSTRYIMVCILAIYTYLYL